MDVRANSHRRLYCTDKLSCLETNWSFLGIWMSHLRDSEAQAAVNTTGSLHLRQITMPDAMDLLYNTAYIIRPRTTNVYSKFILVHCASHSDLGDPTSAIFYLFGVSEPRRQSV